MGVVHQVESTILPQDIHSSTIDILVWNESLLNTKAEQIAAQTNSTFELEKLIMDNFVEVEGYQLGFSNSYGLLLRDSTTSLVRLKATVHLPSINLQINGIASYSNSTINRSNTVVIVWSVGWTSEHSQELSPAVVEYDKVFLKRANLSCQSANSTSEAHFIEANSTIACMHLLGQNGTQASNESVVLMLQDHEVVGQVLAGQSHGQ